VYVPAKSTAGSNIPVPDVNAGNQLPPVLGVPPNCKNKSVAGSVGQMVKLPSIPVFGARVMVTTTSAV